MDNTGGAIINERMRVLLLGKHTGSTRFDHSVLPGRWGGAAASSGQSRSGGGSLGPSRAASAIVRLLLATWAAGVAPLGRLLRLRALGLDWRRLLANCAAGVAPLGCRA